MSSAKDKEELVLNPITGQLDLVNKFNPDRILTHRMNPAGNPRVTYDLNSGLWVTDDDTIVTDSNGNVVVN